MKRVTASSSSSSSSSAENYDHLLFRLSKARPHRSEYRRPDLRPGRTHAPERALQSNSITQQSYPAYSRLDNTVTGSFGELKTTYRPIALTATTGGPVGTCCGV